MKDISEVRKAMDTTQEMFEPLHQMIVMLKQHGVDVSGVQVAQKDVQVRSTGQGRVIVTELVDAFSEDQEHLFRH